jgi:exodeoxyribonuclease VIII
VPKKKEPSSGVIDISTKLNASLALVPPDPFSGLLPAPEPGIYRDVPMDVYQRWDAVSNSRLMLLDRSPAHLKAAIGSPKAETDALRLGTILHSAILEPERFAQTYQRAERCSAIKKDKDQCANMGIEYAGAWLCGVHGGTRGGPVLSPSDYAMCLGVCASTRQHTRANALLSGPGMNELSLVWIDEETGLTCKARLDRISLLLAGGAIVDAKSTRDARMRPFAKAIYQYGYHRQGALYVPGARKLGLEVEHYVIMPFEKEAPFAVATYRLDAGAMDAGEIEVRRLLRLYAECVNKNEWPTTPSYPDTIEDISIPSWAFEMIDTGSEFGA